jgi:hypothetical protein
MTAPPHPASEMRRSAKALVASRTQAFESLHDEAASRERLAKAVASVGRLRFTVHTGAWKQAGGMAIYEATFAPTARVQVFLQALALGIFVLVAASAWVLYSPQESAALKFALPMFTVLAMFAMPLVVNAISSQREAEESRLARAIRAALRDESAAYPPQQRWADED